MTYDPVTEYSDDLVVDARSVRRAFGQRSVLTNVDLAIHRGEFVAMLGRSGSGKSTLLRILAALDTADDGTIRVPARRATVFQEASLLPWKRVIDNVLIGLGCRDARDVGRDALTEVGLADHELTWPATLSGGEAQRVALARALVREPVLLLLDEPFGALDALTRIRMHQLLKEICQRHSPAVLLVTHDVDEALLLADRVVLLKDGQLTLSQPVDLPKPRRRDDNEFNALRSLLLSELGVPEPPDERGTSESNHRGQPDPVLSGSQAPKHRSSEVSVR